MGERASHRAWLIGEMQRLYGDRAWSDAELAERLEVNRSTIYRTRRFIDEENLVALLEESPGRYRIDRQRQLDSIRLTPTEALALYLGGRRLQQQTRMGHLPTASALEARTASRTSSLMTSRPSVVDPCCASVRMPSWDRVEYLSWS